MRISEHSTEQVTVLDLLTPLAGDSSRQLFIPQVEQLLAEGKLLFALNLESLDWIDSTGLGLLIGARRRIVEVGGAMNLCGANPRIKGILDITGLLMVWDLFDDVAAAIADLTKDHNA